MSYFMETYDLEAIAEGGEVSEWYVEFRDAEMLTDMACRLVWMPCYELSTSRLPSL